jgi:hypothetical protein
MTSRAPASDPSPRLGPKPCFARCSHLATATPSPEIFSRSVAWETGRIRFGVLVAIAVAVVGFFGTTLIVSIGRLASIEISGGLYGAFALDQHSPRFALFVALLVLGPALGTVGAIAARGLSRAGLQQRAAI